MRLIQGKAIILFITLLINTVTCQLHSQCECLTSSVADHFDFADLVFVGELISKSVNDQAQFERHGVVNSFRSWHTFKGEHRDTIQIISGDGYSDKGFSFKLAHTYIVFSSRHFVDSCSGTAEFNMSRWSELHSILKTSSHALPPPPPPSAYMTDLDHVHYMTLLTDGGFSKVAIPVGYSGQEFLETISEYMKASLKSESGSYLFQTIFNSDGTIEKLDMAKSSTILSTEQLTQLQEHLQSNFTYVTYGLNCLADGSLITVKIDY